MKAGLEARISAIEKKLKEASGPVGVVIYQAGKWRLYHGGAERDFTTEDAAIEFFYRTASQDAVLIRW